MIWRPGAYYCCFLVPLVFAQYTPTPRWGQAAAVLENTLYIHGGLSDPFNSYSYTSAPEVSDLLLLDLSTSFSVSSPPWQLLSASSSPALAWHTLSAFNTTELLLFGGQPGPNSQTVLTTLNDSAALLSVSNQTSPSFFIEPQNWAGEPMRRIRHSASSTGGKVWIIGGEQADGSGNAFSEHYVFSPFTAEFSLLPSSSNAPPDIYGHASLVLPDGRLVVLGGYCASRAELIPMSTVWSLNTTQSGLAWQALFVSSSSLPSPRRDFAAVVLSNGNILIHGGGDAQLETTFSDGWVLDTSQDPMVWQNVEALAQLGQRMDHIAVQAGGQVLFCFGYGASSPASASLFAYDPTSSSFVSSYTAPAAGSTPAINSLPPPTQTGGSGSAPGSGSDGGASPGTSPVSRPPVTGSDSGSNDHTTTAIALGATFGILGLIAGGLATTHYIKRARDRRGAAGRFFLLGGDLEVAPVETESDIGVPAARGADEHIGAGGKSWVGSGAMLGMFAYLGISNSGPQRPQPRKDMFADEDTRTFAWGARPGIVRREGSEGTTAWSLRSMGAMVRGMASREPSASGTGREWDEWENISRAGEGDREGLIRHDEEFNPYPELALDATRGREGSVWSYTDPFEDPRPDDGYADLDLRPDVLEKDADYDRPLPSSVIFDDYDSTSLRPMGAILSLSVPLRKLSPLKEVSHTSRSEPSNSLPSLPESSQEQSTSQDHSDNSVLPSQPASLSQTSYSPIASRSSYVAPVASSQRYASILNSLPPPSQPIRRSDSWWSRFAKTPLLDRRPSVASNKPLDFRDPTPAPGLVPVEETSGTSPTPPESQDAIINHGRSISSAHSGRTADTEAAERLGGSYDVVQRIASDASSSRRTPSGESATTSEHGLLAVNSPELTEKSTSSKPGPADPPLLTNPPLEASTRTPSLKDVAPAGPTTTYPRRGTAVSGRIQAYERRMSQEAESQRSPPPVNTRKWEEVASRSRPTIQYGLAPRASLFIANPDSKNLP